MFDEEQLEQIKAFFKKEKLDFLKFKKEIEKKENLDDSDPGEEEVDELEKKKKELDEMFKDLLP